MTGTSKRGVNPFDPTAERTSDPKPGEDVAIAREDPRRGETPRRYDGPEEKKDNGPVMPSDDSTLNTQI